MRRETLYRWVQRCTGPPSSQKSGSSASYRCPPCPHRIRFPAPLLDPVHVPQARGLLASASFDVQNRNRRDDYELLLSFSPLEDFPHFVLRIRAEIFVFSYFLVSNSQWLRMTESLFAGRHERVAEFIPACDKLRRGRCWKACFEVDALSEFTLLRSNVFSSEGTIS